MLITLWILVVFLTLALGASLYYLYRFATTLLLVEDAIDVSVRVLEQSHQNISKILEIPVGGDDPFVKAVVTEIKRAQDSVLMVANRLTTGWTQEEGKDVRDEDRDDDTEDGI